MKKAPPLHPPAKTFEKGRYSFVSEKINRIFLIVADSFGCGELPDAAIYGDVGAHTLNSVASSDMFHAPELTRLGLFAIDGNVNNAPLSAFGKMAELSAGKDTVSGHWEIAGLVSETAMPTYPDGFPDDVIDKFVRETGSNILCNKPYSGTDVIYDYGREHVETGDLIVYTSADSVFQIAAHEDVVPIELLYEYCLIARRILTGEHAVGRVIARPFTGSFPDYERTSNRHDYSLSPPRDTLLDVLSRAERDVICVGKINDIFAGSGVTKTFPTKCNADGMAITDRIARGDFSGLCFVNLVDFDSVYGHRRDVDGYASCVSEFDRWLSDFTPSLKSGDLLIITADHGCDPAFTGSDHTREYVPLLIYGDMIKAGAIPTRASFADLGKTVAELLSVGENSLDGVSFADLILK